MYVYTDKNTHTIVYIHIYYHSCNYKHTKTLVKLYVYTDINTHINVCKRVISNFNQLYCKSQCFTVKINFFVIIIF